MSDLPAGDERLRAAFAALSRRAETAPGCPEPALLWSALEGRAAPPEVDRVLDHMVACPACAEAWRLGRELWESAPRPAGARPETAVAAATAWPAWGTIAAGLAAVALAAGALLTLGPPESGYREGTAFSIESRTAEEVALPRSACRLRWTPGPDGTRYSLVVTTPDLETLDRALGLEAAEYRVPEAALEGLPPGSRILWQVEAVLPDGSRVTSATFVSRLE